MKTKTFRLEEIVLGKEGLLKGPFGSDLKRSLYVPKDSSTYKVYLQENILKSDLTKGTHYISNNYFVSKMSRYAVKEGDFIVTCDGTLGEIFRLNGLKEKGIISSSLLRITLDESKVDPIFFPYFWKTRIKKPLIRSHNNSVLKHLPGLKAIRAFTIEMPSLTAQKSIAKVLSDIDAKIVLNNKINAELESMAKLIYDYWFVQFDFPDENGKPYKSSGGKMVYNEDLKREIPEEWESGELKDMAILYRGVTYNKSDILDSAKSNSTPILRATNITKNSIDNDNMVFVGSHLVNENQRLDKYDILITMSSGSKEHIGKNGLYYFENEVGYGAFCSRIVSKVPISKFYLGIFMQSDFTRELIKKQCLGTNINNLNNGTVNGFPLPIPPDSVLSNFNNSVSSIFEQISNNYKENVELAEVRDWLLPMLMNGQVTIKD